MTGAVTDFGIISGERSIVSLTHTDTEIYGGTTPNGHLFKFYTVNNTIIDLGNVIAGERVVSALTTGIDNNIYGGTGVTEGHLFKYNTTSGIFTDIGEVLPAEPVRIIRTLVTYSDGKIYGGVTSLDSAHLFVYEPATNTIIDLGIPVTGMPYISSLTVLNDRIYGSAGTHLFVYNITTNTTLDLGIIIEGDYLDNLITDGTYIYGTIDNRLFVYNPTTNETTDLGVQVPDVPWINALTYLNGSIYGATGGDIGTDSGFLFVYNCSTNITRLIGRAVRGEARIDSLVEFNNKIYGGTAPNAHFFVSEPNKYWRNGYITSYIYDGISITNWTYIKWSEHLSPNTDIIIQTRTGNRPFENYFIDYGNIIEMDEYVFAVTADENGNIYGGTGTAEGHLVKLDTESITDIGIPPTGQTTIGSLAYLDGKVYGGTGHIYGSSGEGHLFVYDIQNDTIIDLGIPVASERAIQTLIPVNGKIYGGTYANGHLFVYDPVTNTFTDLGIPVLGEYIILSLTLGIDNKIYGSAGSHLFSYEPKTNTITNLGIPEATDGNWIWTLTACTDGKIYGGLDWIGSIFVYDPITNTSVNLGVPVTGASNIYSLTTAPDGKIYGGTGWEKGHLFVYDPVLNITTDLGQMVEGDDEIWSLAASNGRIYGGTGCYEGHIFTYDYVWNWSAWTNYTVSEGEFIKSPSNRYIQYRAILMTDDQNVTPVLNDILVLYNNTRAGTNVSVSLASNIDALYSQVSAGGNTFVIISSIPSPPSAPTGFEYITDCYRILTDAHYTNMINVSIMYDENALPVSEKKLAVLYYDELLQRWLDVTKWLDTESNKIYGSVYANQMFALMIFRY
jgi:hypothetical protein